MIFRIKFDEIFKNRFACQLDGSLFNRLLRRKRKMGAYACG
ncbi:hypothetical protein [Moraxella lacunata]